MAVFFRLPWLWSNTWENSFKKERFVWSQVWSFQSIVGWLCCLWAYRKAEYHGGEHVVEQSCSSHRGHATGREQERMVPGTSCVLPGDCLSGCFLQLVLFPQFRLPPNTWFNYELLNRLIHWSDWSIDQNAITSQKSALWTSLHWGPSL